MRWHNAPQLRVYAHARLAPHWHGLASPIIGTQVCHVTHLCDLATCAPIPPIPWPSPNSFYVYNPRLNASESHQLRVPQRSRPPSSGFACLPNLDVRPCHLPSYTPALRGVLRRGVQC